MPLPHPTPVRCDAAQAAELIERHDVWVLDLDGTVWRGAELIKGAKEALELLRSLGKRIVYFTNNSMRSRQAYVDKLVALGLPANLDDIYSSSFSAAAYLKSVGYDCKRKAYVVGERGIMEELAAVGITSFGGPDHNDLRVDFSIESPRDMQVGAVVCGVDPGLSYYKIHYAAQCLLQNPDCLFIATNTDSRGHFSPDMEWPGAGATAGAIQAVVERAPVVTGKPSPFLMQAICKHHSITPERAIIVGDRLDTDVAWGLATGLTTLLVMTGVTDEPGLAAQQAAAAALATGSNDVPPLPHYVMGSLADLLHADR